MGFRPKKKIYNLVFDDPDMDGLEVKIRGLNTGQLLDIDTARDDGGEEAISSMLQLMADRLVSWNVEDDEGQPVPADMDGIRQQELAFNMAVISAWQDAVGGVPGPLDAGSTSTELSLVESIPMEAPSPPPASTAVPA